MFRRLFGRPAKPNIEEEPILITKMGQYPEQRPDWANLSVIHRNTLPPRASFFLYETEKAALTRDVDNARAICLSGTWKFHLANSPFSAPAGFESKFFDASAWSDITVPGMWQLQGFGRGPQYTNVQYPFHVDPPYPPYEGNECGSYVTTFTVPKHLQGEQLRLRFEGVDSAFHVWINGQDVGYSQGSRNPSEFDVTKFVEEGNENVLAVRVYQFCDGSYIEDQDQWWLSGIFRDVFLLAFPKSSHIQDFTIRTVLDKKFNDATLHVNVQTIAPCSVKLKLHDATGAEVATATSSGSGTEDQSYDLSMDVHNPHKWTAETPYLYTLIIAASEGQYTTQRVGFRQVEVKDGMIKVNGQRVVFKGANRHEHHPKSGRTVPLEFLKRDLLLMKTHNINAIRTCHQPSDPRLYDLADELGFWVMDEADLECHGFAEVGHAERWTSDNPEWHDAYLDRAKQLVFRDKNHPCVVLWSLGNEAFYGRNHTAMYEWIKRNDPTRPIHYEQDYGADHVDILSRMYPSVIEIILMAQGECKRKKKPLVLCEYVHAMGTGPGNVKEYVDAFYKYPQLQGGWVWEWANHGLLTKTADGMQFYGYGGDFGDQPNDYNFVMDGVCQSDHTPNSGLVEYGKAMEPVQLVESNEKSIKIINRYDFADLDHLICEWSLVDEKGPVPKHLSTIDIQLGVKPGAIAELQIPALPQKLSGESFADLSFRLKQSTLWADRGHEVAWLQVPVSTFKMLSKPQAADPRALKVTATSSALKISGYSCEWTIGFANGGLSSWKKDGKEIIARPLQPSFYRALTDNDAPADGREWKDCRLHLANLQTRSIAWSEKDGSVIVNMEQKYAPPVLAWSLDLQTRYTFEPSGSARVQVKGKPSGDRLPKTIPRIGVELGLSADFQKVEWFGRGPGECYKDMKLSQRIALHSVEQVDDLWASPDFPQECSNRTDTRWVKVSSAGNASLHAQFFSPSEPDKRKPFDFMACHYEVHDIDAAQHPYELSRKKKAYVMLRLDVDHHGLGTGSCGPKTLDKYALKTDAFEFGILLQ